MITSTRSTASQITALQIAASQKSRALIALLPFLCACAAISLVATNGTVRGQSTVRGQTKDATKQPAAQTVSLTKIRPLIADLDTLFIDGDIKAYLRKFTPDHEGALAMLGRHLELLLTLSGKERSRKSTIVAGPMVFEDRTVVRIRHITTWPGKADPKTMKPGEPRTHIEDTYLAVRNSTKDETDGGDNGGVVPTFEIDMPPKIHCVTDAKFRCPPCNYEIGGVDGFLCVPLRRERGLALESASFYLIGTDVACDVHVQVPSKPIKAKAVVLKLAEAFAKLEPSAKVGIPAAWLPPMHQKEPPAGLDSARLVVELPLDHEQSGGDVSVFHVVAFGGVQHVLLLRSSKASLLRHKQAIDKLFMSYMLLEVDCKDAELATRPLRMHTGGMIEGSTYLNDRYDLKLDGPDGWKTQHRVGGSMFRVGWSGPNASHMWLVGHQVPAEMTAWTKETADRWLNHHQKKYGLVPDKEQAASDEANWHQCPDGSTSRTVVLLQQRRQRPDTPRRRIVHMQLHSDLLLLVDGFGGTEADEQSVRTAIRTLKRK
ncbi:MAG: hypothetical protein ACI9SE_001659 [Neolewinella sp.]|jgi:hypothetical protein